MKVIIQRVKKSCVKVEGKKVGSINNGLLVFLGIAEFDQEEGIQKMVDKILKLRIFSDENDKMNLSLLDTSGEVLIVSQFTLYGDTKKGNRPSFAKSANPQKALLFYNKFVEYTRELVGTVETGVFGANMEVEIVNDGPVTIIIEI